MESFDEFMRRSLKFLTEPDEVKVAEVEIGLAKQEQMKRLDSLQTEHDRLHEELKEQADAFIKQEEEAMDKRVSDFVDSLEEGHQPECIRLNEELTEVWTEIKNDLGVAPEDMDKDYQMDIDTGMISILEDSEHGIN